MRTIIGNSKTYWLITINESLSDKDKYITLIHELLHCTIDEIKLLERNDEENVIKHIEDNL